MLFCWSKLITVAELLVKSLHLLVVLIMTALLSFAPMQQAVSCTAHPVTNYTVTLTSNTSTPITWTVTTPPKNNVSITVGGLNDNTLYTYQVHANNAIGSAASAVKTFCEYL